MEFKKGSWSVEKIEEIDATDSIGKIFKLSGVKYTNNPNEETIHYPGKTFMGTATLYIWHYLYETIAQFEYLKTQIPDLNMVMFSETGHTDITIEEFLNAMKEQNFYNKKGVNYFPEPHKYFEDTFKVYVNQKYINNFRTTNVSFDEIYFTFDQKKAFVDIMQKGIGKFWFGLPHAYWIKPNFETFTKNTRDYFYEIWWRDLGLMCMRNTWLKELKNDESTTPKKILISRKDANLRYKENTIDAILPLHDRLIDEDLNNMVEDYFVANGYTSITLEGMGYLEQLRYFKNAESIVAIIGSGLCQTFICDHDVNVTEILLNKRYNFSYEFIAENVGFKLCRLDLRKFSEDKEKVQNSLEAHLGYLKSLEALKNDKF